MATQSDDMIKMAMALVKAAQAAQSQALDELKAERAEKHAILAEYKKALIELNTHAIAASKKKVYVKGQTTKDMECIFWLRGKCNRKNCPFKHVEGKEGSIKSGFTPSAEIQQAMD